MGTLTEHETSSSVSIGLFVFAATVACTWMLCKHKQARVKRRVVNYRRVFVSHGDVLESKEATKINALVTGGSGMLGREIVLSLLKDGGYKVHSLDLFIPEGENQNSEVCSYIQTDITDLDDLSIAVKSMDVVFHTAAILPTVIGAKDSDFENVIFKGTQNVIAACKENKVKRLIYTSTADVVIGVGKIGVNYTDENQPLPQHPLNAYVSAKGRAEMAVLAANDNETLTTSAIRPGGILEMVVYPKLTHLFYVGDRGRTLPLVARGDLAKAHLHLDKVLTDKKTLAAGKAFNLSWNIPESELDESISSELGDHLKVRQLPMFLFMLLTYINVFVHWLTGIPPFSSLMTLMALDILNLKYHSYCCDRACKELGWKLTPWKHIVKRLVDTQKESKH